MMDHELLESVLNDLKTLGEEAVPRWLRYMPTDEKDQIIIALIKSQTAGSSPQASGINHESQKVEQEVSEGSQDDEELQEVDRTSFERAQASNYQTLERPHGHSLTNKESAFFCYTERLLAAAREHTEQREAIPPSQNASLPFVIMVDGKDDRKIIKDIRMLPLHVSQELMDRFHATHSTATTRTRNFNRACNDPELRVEDGLCLRDFFTYSTAILKETHVNNKFTDGGVPRESADDVCISKKSPCAYVLECDAVPAFCFVPLPYGLREGISWLEINYWIQSGRHVAQ